MRFIFIAVCTVLLYSCSSSKTFDISGGIVKVDEISIPAPTDGKILSMNIKRGDNLTPNLIVAQLDTINIAAQLATSEAEILAEEARTVDLTPLTEMFNAQKLVLKAELNLLEDQLKKDLKEESRYTILAGLQSVTGKELDDRNAQVSQTKAKIEIAKALINKCEADFKSTRQKAVRENEAIIKHSEVLKRKYHELKLRFEQTTVKNGVYGTVTDLFAHAEESPGVDKVIYKVADFSKIYVEVYLSAKYFRALERDGEVEIFIDDEDGGYRSYSGRAIPTAEKGGYPDNQVSKSDRDENVYRVKINIDHIDAYLKPDMAAQINLKRKL